MIKLYICKNRGIITVGSRFGAQAQKVWDPSPVNPVQ